MRHKIALAEIREIHPPLNMRQTVYGNGRSRASVPSRIELNGDFGAVSLSFRSKEKRDELYLALVPSFLKIAGASLCPAGATRT